MELYEARPVALVFLRHLGCIFCKDQVASLRGRNDLNLAFISISRPDEAQAFNAAYVVTHPHLCDPEEDLYREFGLPNARISQVVNLGVMGRGLRASLAGHRNRASGHNAQRMGGTFVVRTNGEISWSRVSRHVGDYPSPDEIGAALLVAGEKA